MCKNGWKLLVSKIGVRIGSIHAHPIVTFMLHSVVAIGPIVGIVHATNRHYRHHAGLMFIVNVEHVII